MKMEHGKYWKKHEVFSIYYVMNITMEELIRIIREELTTFAGGGGHLSYPKGKLPKSDNPKDMPKASVVVRVVGKKELYKSPEEEPPPEEEIDVSIV